MSVTNLTAFSNHPTAAKESGASMPEALCRTGAPASESGDVARESMTPPSAINAPALRC